MRNGFIFADTSEDLEGCGNFVRYDSQRSAYGGYHTIVCNPKKDFDSKYLAYLFTTEGWRSQIRRDLVDVKLFSVNQTSLHETYLVLPPMETQQVIVNYLDKRCAAIDEGIVRRRKIIEKLEEYKRSVIFQAVTKGLDPDAKMVDSGIDWIGKMPAGWAIRRIKHAARLSSGGTPSREHVEYWNGHIPWVKTGELNNGVVSGSEEAITELGLTRSSAKIYPRGTLLMAMYGQGKTRGTTGCLGMDAAINQACVAFTRLNGVSRSYLWMVLRAIYGPLREAAIGSGQPNLSIGLISDFPIPIPSDLEQAEIAAYLNRKCGDADSAITRQRRLIEKLEEYRESLTAHAVTGKIDCTED